MNNQNRMKISRLAPLVIACCVLVTVFFSVRRSAEQEAKRAEIKVKLDHLQEEIKGLNEQIKTTAEARKQTSTPAPVTPAATPVTTPEKAAVAAPAAP